MGAPVGNQNAAKAKQWAAAIGRALDKRSSEGRAKALDDLAAVLLDEAARGNLAAIKELGDRLDGKSAQSMTLGSDPDQPLLARVERVIVDSAN